MRLKRHWLECFGTGVRGLNPVLLYVACLALQVLHSLRLQPEHILSPDLFTHQVLHKQVLVSLLDALSSQHILLMVFKTILIHSQLMLIDGCVRS